MNLNNISDYHTHNFRCKHANGTLQDYLEAALKLGLGEIGFSDHFPYEFLKDLGRIPYKEYAMTLDEIPNYLKTAEDLREKYKKQIKVKIGFEIDFIVDQEDILNEILKNYLDQLDYIIGSVHILDGKDSKWCLDDKRFLEEYNYFGIDNVYLKYFQKLEKMILSNKYDFDIVAHFDLPKKFNKFPTNNDMIFEKAIKVLEFIKKKGMVVEINTSGFRKEVKEQYPSWDIIREMYNLDIPILLGSDAHLLTEVGYMFKEVLSELKKIGFNQLVRFTKRKKEDIDF